MDALAGWQDIGNRRVVQKRFKSIRASDVAIYMGMNDTSPTLLASFIDDLSYNSEVWHVMPVAIN